MKKEDFSPEGFEHLLNAAMQRAALMGIIAAILEDEVTETAQSIKTRICCSLGEMIDRDIMVKDFIDVHVVAAVKNFLEQEIAVEEAKDIISFSDN
jgi:hypothetical protein